MLKKDALLKAATERFEEFRDLHRHDNFYDFEKEFEKIWLEPGREVLQQSLGDVPEERQKKRVRTRFGRVELAHTHAYYQPESGTRMSPYLQELSVYAGHLDVYEKGAEILGKFLRVKPHTTRVYRVTRDLGAAIEESLYSVVVPTTVPEQQTVYAMLDGSMIFTDNQWREVKLGRLFAAGAIVQAGSAQAQRDRGRSITDSEYVACLGGHEEFTRRFSRLIEQHRDRGKDLVFVNDGAAWIWIWTWITENYPEATQILDFYHAAEYLGGFARVCYDSEEQSRSWRAGQKALQLAGQFDRVVSAIRRSACRRSKAVRNEADRVLRYFRTHRDRMHYDEYIRWGLMIGSGAVESAHRTVVQARMKLSGQRWTNDGASDMLNLRVASLGCRWDELVVGHIRRAARAE